VVTQSDMRDPTRTKAAKWVLQIGQFTIS
jgi:hypothetical protein